MMSSIVSKKKLIAWHLIGHLPWQKRVTGYNLNLFPAILIDKLHELRKNADYIGNSTNHFIPRKRRPDWRIFIDTLSQNLERFFMTGR